MPPFLPRSGGRGGHPARKTPLSYPVRGSGSGGEERQDAFGICGMLLPYPFPWYMRHSIRSRLPFLSRENACLLFFISDGLYMLHHIPIMFFFFDSDSDSDSLRGVCSMWYALFMPSFPTPYRGSPSVHENLLFQRGRGGKRLTREV
jgi:hypothetical protein